MRTNLSIASILLALAIPLSAHAQPTDDGETPLDPFAEPAPGPATDPAPAPAPAPEPAPPPPDTETYNDPYARQGDDGSYALEEVEVDNDKKRYSTYKHPMLLAAPTAHLLPAAMIQSSTSLDTGGGFGSSARVGLGDVGEFGVETTHRIRYRQSDSEAAETVQPLVLASFKMGVGEGRLFDHQPALALGFRKSFKKEHREFDIRVAAIELVASKTFGKVAFHAGGVFWDASMDHRFDENVDPVLFHDNDRGTGRQIRPIGGVEAEPLKNAQLLVDLYWVPLFVAQQDLNKRIVLRPTLSWGVRYKVSEKVSIESGVRVPDIGEANLLDAQIFGQFSFSTSALRNALGVGL